MLAARLEYILRGEHARIKSSRNESSNSTNNQSNEDFLDDCMALIIRIRPRGNLN